MSRTLKEIPNVNVQKAFSSLPKRRNRRHRNEETYCECEPHGLTASCSCLNDYELLIPVPSISASIGSGDGTYVVLAIMQ
jgi:hypothetical protein